ncbi:hypothetical protein Zmor_018103 [Zophobas morio]|uniref:Uncharacterized protein n=1 Tax=Zophobas morio TaxID=2755281 RepID=A0AA38I6A4_9CUCU|nr:hypothetical protein Zmor_018103 [Zophobas morio]
MGLRFGTANGTSHSSTERFSSCGKIWHGKPIPLPYLKTVTGIQGNEEYGDIDSSEDEFTDCDETDANLAENSRLEVGEKPREDDIDDNDDVLEDLCIVSSDALGLKNLNTQKYLLQVLLCQFLQEMAISALLENISLLVVKQYRH